jgi:hypothetical protein
VLGKLWPRFALLLAEATALGLLGTALARRRGGGGTSS